MEINHELNRELIGLLKQFQKAQFDKFFDFMESPYCYKDMKLKQSLNLLKSLLTFLEKNIGNDAGLTRKRAIKALNKLFAMSDSRIRRAAR